MNEAFKRILPTAGALIFGIAIGNLTSSRVYLGQSTAQMAIAADRSSRPSDKLVASEMLAMQPISAKAEKSRDVDQTLREALNLPGRLQRQRALCDWVLGLSAEETTNAAASFDQLPKHDQEQLLPMLMARWAETDPVAAISFLMASKNPVVWSHRSTAMQAVFEPWIMSDPEAAITWVSRLPSGKNRMLAHMYFTETLARYDAPKALEFLNNGPRSDDDSRTYMNLFHVWAERNPSVAAAQALKIRSKSLRNMAIQGLINTWAETNPAGALTWAEQISDTSLRSGTLSALFSAWAVNDPSGAAAQLLAMPPDKKTWEIVGAVIGGAASRDISTAKSIAEQLPVGLLRDKALSKVASHWADIDPEAAAAFTEQLPPGDARDSAAQSVVTFWSDHHPAEALAWAQRVLSGEALESALSDIGERWVDLDPRTAAETIAGITKDPGILGDVLGEWAQTNPRDAAAWAGALAESDSRATAFFRIAQEWAKEEVVESAGWLEKLPAGRSRDQAINGFIQSVADTDPEAAVSWAATISDPAIKTGTLETLFSNWSARDAGAARTWLTGTSLLSPQAKAQLLRKH